MTFFSHQLQILNFRSIFATSIHSPIIVSPLLFKISLCFRKIYMFFTYFVFFLSPSLTMMHLSITQCTYWMPLLLGIAVDSDIIFIIISGLPSMERSRFLIHEASSPPSSCWARNEHCGTENLWPQFRGKLISRFVPPATCQAGVG